MFLAGSGIATKFKYFKWSLNYEVRYDTDKELHESLAFLKRSWRLTKNLTMLILLTVNYYFNIRMKSDHDPRGHHQVYTDII